MIEPALNVAKSILNTMSWIAPTAPIPTKTVIELEKRALQEITRQTKSIASKATSAHELTKPIDRLVSEINKAARTAPPSPRSTLSDETKIAQLIKEWDSYWKTKSSSLNQLWSKCHSKAEALKKRAIEVKTACLNAKNLLTWSKYKGKSLNEILGEVYGLSTVDCEKANEVLELTKKITEQGYIITDGKSYRYATYRTTVLAPKWEYYVRDKRWEYQWRLLTPSEKLSRLEREFNEFKRLVSEVEDDLRKMYSKLQQLQSELRAPRKTIPSQPEKTGKSTTEKPQPVTDSELLNLRREKDNLIAKVKEVAGDLRSLESRISSLSAEIPRLESEKTSLEKLKSRLQSEISELQRRLENIRTASEEALKSRLESLKSYVEGLRSQKVTLESKIRQVKASIESLKKKLSELGISYMIWTGGGGYVSPGGTLARETYYVPERFTSVEELNKWKSKLRAEINRERAELNQLLSDKSRLAAKLSSLMSRRQELTNAIEALKKEVNKLKSTVSNLRSKLSEGLPANLKKLQDQINSLEEERDRLESEVAGLMEELSNLESEELRLRNLLVSAGVTIPTPPVPTVPPTVSPDVSMLVSQIQSLQQQLQNLQQQIINTQQRAATEPVLLSEIERLKQEKQALQQQLYMLQQQLIQMSRERPQDVSIPVMMALIQQMQSQARLQAEMMRSLYESMLQQKHSTSAAEIKALISEMEKDRQMLLKQIEELEKQVEELKKAPPAPPRPAWYPGMIIRSIIASIFPTGMQATESS